MPKPDIGSIKSSRVVKHEEGDKLTSLITWGPLVAIVVVIAIYLLSQIIGAFLIGLYPIINHWSSTRTNNWVQSSVYAQFWFTVFVESISVFLIVLFLRRRHSNLKSIGLRGHPGFLDIAYSFFGFLIYGVIYYPVIIVLASLAPGISSVKQDIGFSTSSHGLALWLIFFSLVVLPPIVEEILFRGFLYSGLKTKLNKLNAAIATSLIFASFHLIEGVSGVLWIGGIDTFILSMVLIFLRDRTDKLWASMGLHMLKNFVAFASLFLFHIS